MKNIAIITDSISRGGAERAAGQLSIFLSKKYNIYMFVIENYDITYDYSGQKIDFYLNEKYNKMKKSKNIFRRMFAKVTYLKVIYEIKQKKKELHIDYSISFLELMSIMNILSHYRDKVIVSVRNNRSEQNDCFLRRLENWSIKKFYNKTHKVISLSYGVTEDLINNFKINPNKIETIYNFYDLNKMLEKANCPLPNEYLELFKNNRIILTMGRLIEQKNTINLVEIISSYLENKTNIKLLILGQGPLKEDIEQKIKELKMENKIILCGYNDNPFPLIKNAELFIINSKFEGFCNSIVEAMACGTYVISTDCKYGPRELIAEKKEYKSKISKFTIYNRGILTPLDKPIEMKKAIEYILDNEEVKNKGEKNAIQYVRNISNKNLLKKWISIIEEGDYK